MSSVLLDDPPTVEEIVAVMRQAGTTPHGLRMRGLIVVLWRAGLRIHEALALTEADLDARRGSVLIRRGKGGRRREVGMDDYRTDRWLLRAGPQADWLVLIWCRRGCGTARSWYRAE
jgi:site-specific recombinase XerD